jgi:hypothetical protein
MRCSPTVYAPSWLKKLDRLSRSLLVQEAIIAELTKLGFNLVSAHEPKLISKDPTRIAFRQMMGVFAQYDKGQIVLKLRAARLRKRTATGRCEGRKPYGFYDGERETLERMRGWHAEGVSLNQVAARLNQRRFRHAAANAGMAAVLEPRLHQTQAEPMPLIDFLACLVSDELTQTK